MAFLASLKIKKSEFSANKLQEIYQKLKSEFNKSLPENLTNNQIQSILASVTQRDVIYCAPTGSGKTMGILLPSYFASYLVNKNFSAEIVTLVILPLESLMKDYMSRLAAIGFPGTRLTQEMVDDVNLTWYQSKKQPEFFLASPELAVQKSFGNLFAKLDFFLICVDESHCIIQWGTDPITQKPFRGQYSKLSTLRSFSVCSMGLYTATITHTTATEMRRLAAISEDAEEIIDPPNRPNIFVDVRAPTKDEKNLNCVIETIKKFGIAAPKTLIFVQTIKEVTDIYLYLWTTLGSKRVNQTTGDLLIGPYTGSSGEVSQEIIFNKFKNPASSLRVVVCSSAFSMGIDIKDITKVIILGLPLDIMSLWQMIGRCGRGGQQSHATIFPYKTPFFRSRNGNLNLPNQSCFREFILQSMYKCEAYTITHVRCKNPPCGPICRCTYCTCCSFCALNCLCKKKK